MASERNVVTDATPMEVASRCQIQRLVQLPSSNGFAPTCHCVVCAHEQAGQHRARAWGLVPDKQ